MKTQRIEQNNNSQKFPISKVKGTPLNSRLTEVKHIKMEFKDHHIEIQLNVDGLCGKNYKLEVVDDDLVLTTLRFVMEPSADKTHSFGNYKWVTSTYFLPYYVEGKEIKSELRKGILYIRIPTKDNSID